MSILQPEEIEELAAILNRLCPHQAGWTMEPPTEDDRRAILAGPESMQVLISVMWNAPNRLRMCGLFPTSPDGHSYLPLNQKVPEISVARARGLYAIATAIQRRLLPIYRPLLEQANERADAHRDALAQQDATVTELAQIPGCTKRLTPGQVDINWRHLAGDMWGQAEATLDGWVNLKLHRVPAPAAHEVLVILHRTLTDIHRDLGGDGRGSP